MQKVTISRNGVWVAWIMLENGTIRQCGGNVAESILNTIAFLVQSSEGLEGEHEEYGDNWTWELQGYSAYSHFTGVCACNHKTIKQALDCANEYNKDSSYFKRRVVHSDLSELSLWEAEELKLLCSQES